MQERHHSSELAMELCLFCTNSLKCAHHWWFVICCVEKQFHPYPSTLLHCHWHQYRRLQKGKIGGEPRTGHPSTLYYQPSKCLQDYGRYFWPFWVTLCGNRGDLESLIVKEISLMCNGVVSSVGADSLVLPGESISAGIVMAMFWSHLYIGL